MKKKKHKQHRFPDLNTFRIMTGKVCPYCNKPTKYVDSKVVYSGKSYGMIYLCEPCNAWVGTHKVNPKEALGRLANFELRELKKEAHKYFDFLWVKKMKQTGWTKQDCRTAAYKWLQDTMHISASLAHIGMFNEEQCKKVIELCKPYYQ